MMPGYSMTAKLTPRKTGEDRKMDEEEPVRGFPREEGGCKRKQDIGSQMTGRSHHHEC